LHLWFLDVDRGEQLLPSPVVFVLSLTYIAREHVFEKPVRLFLVDSMWKLAILIEAFRSFSHNSKQMMGHYFE
jgi:hypothetical protein